MTYFSEKSKKILQDYDQRLTRLLYQNAYVLNSIENQAIGANTALWLEQKNTSSFPIDISGNVNCNINTCIHKWKVKVEINISVIIVSISIILSILEILHYLQFLSSWKVTLKLTIEKTITLNHMHSNERISLTATQINFSVKTLYNAKSIWVFT